MSSHRARSSPLLCRMSPSRLLPPDALLSSWLIVKSSHQLRCPPLLLLPIICRRAKPSYCAASLHQRAATPFIVAPPVLPSLSRRRGLHHRTAADCHAAAAFVVAPPLPSLLCRRSLPRRAAGSAFVNALPLPSSSRRRSLRRRATVSAFAVAPPLPSSSRGHCLHRRSAVSAFVVGPPVCSAVCRHLPTLLVADC